MMLTVSIFFYFLKVEPSRKRFHSGFDQRLLQNTGPTRREDGLAQCGVIIHFHKYNIKLIKRIKLIH